MKRAFIRGLWGVYSNENNVIERRYKMDADVKQTLENKHSPPSVTYVFGEENYNHLKDLGVEDLKLVDKNPDRYDLSENQYRHKLDILKIALEDYDEILFIDWDCQAKKPLPNDFWEVMGKKEYCQANLQQYKRKKCFWRGKHDTRKLPNAGFLYIRDKTFPDEIIKCWEANKGNSAEPPLARAMDDRSGGWVGKEKYWELYEPEFCNLWKFSAFTNEQIKSKRCHFLHYQGLPSYRYNKNTKYAGTRGKKGRK
jgi:hypothetical protein